MHETLARLFEAMTQSGLVPRLDDGNGASRMGGGRFAWALQETDPLKKHDIHFASAAMGIWLCRNAGPLFMELGRVISSSGDSQQLSPIVLTQRILDYLATETQGASATEQARYVAELMIAAGLGLHNSSTGWDTYLRKLVVRGSDDAGKTPAKGFAQTLAVALATVFRKRAIPQHRAGVRDVEPLIRWAFEVETAAGDKRSKAHPNSALESLPSSFEGIVGFDMNQWAYLLLRLELFHAAAPLARQALALAGTNDFLPEPLRNRASDAIRRHSVAMCQDTCGWALCYSEKYSEARELLNSAVKVFPAHGDEWYEVQYHRAHVAYWSGEHKESEDIIREMEQANGTNNLWTKRAAHLIANVVPSLGHAQGVPYDVVISFAGEDRPYALELAGKVKARGFSVFYDDFERASLWGRNLYEHLTDIYQNKGRYCVVLISRHYARKRWTQLEWRAVEARCLREKGPYCLPVRIDDTELPGLLPTTSYLSLQDSGMDRVSDVLLEVLNRPRAEG